MPITVEAGGGRGGGGGAGNPGVKGMERGRS